MDRQFERYLLLGLGSLAYGALMFCWFSLPAFLPVVIADVGLTETQAGVLAGAVPLVYVPLSLGTGLLIDRAGSRPVVAVGVFTFGVAHALRGTADAFLPMLAATLLLGVGATTITFGLPKLVSELFPAERSGTMASVYLLGSYAGTTTAFTLARPVLAPWLGGWRAVFRWSGAAVVALGVLWALAVWYARGVGDRAAGGSAFSLDSVREDVWRVVTDPSMQLLVVVGTTYLLLVHGTQGWLPTVLESRGVGEGAVALVTGSLVLAQAAGTAVVPPLADRFEARRRAVVACGSLAAAGGLAVVLGGHVALTALGVLAVGAGVGGVSPLVRAIPVELDAVGPELTGVAVGLVFMVGEVGGFAGPVVVGTLRDITGTFVPGLLVLAAGGVVMALAGARLDV